MTGVVRVDDAEPFVASIVLAFSADPFLRWLMPLPEMFLRLFPQITGLHGAAAAAAGGAWGLEDGRGAAFWYPPGHGPDAEAMRAIAAEAGFGERVGAVFAQVTPHVPSEPSWYLRQIGVDPTLQGQGAGAALIAAGVAQADADGTPAYLEATSDSSRRFYERYGFEHVTIAQAGDSPPLYVMVRP
jgi:GNAT superfamily N-acetyltransferase